jgi:hypothetical protein
MNEIKGDLEAFRNDLTEIKTRAWQMPTTTWFGAWIET